MLRDLDNANFPAFDNLNFDFVSARLHGFAGPDGAWALVIQNPVHWAGGSGLVTLGYCFGACVAKTDKEKFKIWQHVTFEHGETGRIRLETLKVRDVAVDAATLELPKHPLLIRSKELEIELAVGIALLTKHREAMFADDATVAALVTPDVKQIVKLDDWPHPAAGTPPSDSPFFQRLAETLTSDGKTPLGPITDGNINWRYWLERKAN